MDKLTKDEVLHVAELGRINLSDDEVDKFSYQLKALLNEINKINEIELGDEDILISPSCNECVTRNDEATFFENPNKLIENAPKRFDSFIEVVGVFDE